MAFLAQKLEDKPRPTPAPTALIEASAAPIRSKPLPTAAPTPMPSYSPAPESITVLMGEDCVETSLEEYILGVLAAEMPAAFETEALKAQSVAARTYALYCAAADKHGDAQVCTDFRCCQAWKSEEQMREGWGESFDAYYEKLRAAVYATAGQYLSYGGKPVFAAFHSSSSGMTESCGAIWSELPYLISVPSPESEQDVPGYISTVELSPLDFRDSLLHACPEADFSGEEGQWIGGINYEDSGRVDSLLIGGVLYSGAKLRELFSLRSTAFSLEYTGESFLFTVTGYGHGVGMSQYGARVMAREGADYSSILAHYYPGTVLVG